jgi:NAD(P)-dependent dehydrogenase (short-subunit alcohol dehydrogenase family)
MRTWLITGGTPGGLGMAFAEAALAAGDRVALTARPIKAERREAGPREAEPREAGPREAERREARETLRDWAARHGDRAFGYPLDVTDARQIAEAVTAVQERFGGIDVLVNNAGRGLCGSVEESPDAEIRATMDLNFFSVVAMLKAVLPGMRRRRSGWVINVSSAAGLSAVPGFGYYSAAKFAVEGLSEALRREVEPLGIRVLVVEPGAFRTNAYAAFADAGPTIVSDDYRPMMTAIHRSMVQQHGHQPGDPARGARAVVAALAAAEPPQRLLLGNAAFDRTVAELEHTLLEFRSWEKVTRDTDFAGR